MLIIIILFVHTLIPHAFFSLRMTKFVFTLQMAWKELMIIVSSLLLSKHCLLYQHCFVNDVCVVNNIFVCLFFHFTVKALHMY